MEKSLVDPAFRSISKSSTAFLIWRVENLQLVALPKDQYGTFYDGDSYIIYVASEHGKFFGPTDKPKDVRGRLEIHIHFWLGKDTSQDESAVAAFKTVELDNYLGGAPVQHREVMGNESFRFKSYFKTGMRIMKGGVGSGLSSVNNNFEPKLFRVKGRRLPVITQMPSVAWQFFNTGDVFIIDTKDVVFVWIGKHANGMEKLQATKVAMQLKTEHNAISIVFVDDGKESELLEAEKMLLGVYLDLNPTARRGLAANTEDEKSEKESRAALRLYKCSDADGTYKVTEVKTGPLEQSDLNSNDSYIIDNGPIHIWVWVGKKASSKERVEAIRNAHGFVKKKNYNKSTRVSRVVDGGEPAEFKALFTSWREKETVQTRTSLSDVYHFGQVAKAIPAKLDAAALHSAPHIAAQEQLIDDGSGKCTVWRVFKSQLVNVIESNHGIFYSGDCYIVKYTYQAHGSTKHILYYWLGLHSSVSEQTAAALLTVGQDEALNGSAVQVRVIQGKEPPHFLAIFKGKVLIMNGEHSDVLPKRFMVQVRGHCNYKTRATQVDFQASSLNSSDVFVVCTGAICYIWCGKGSTGDEREMAKKIAQAVSGPEFVALYEGQEKDEFWDALGGKKPYCNQKRLQDERNDRLIRLFHCSNATGTFTVEEIVDFSQSDLLSEDVMLLDAMDSIFIWIGVKANREEKTKALQFAFEYLKTDHSGRDPNIPVILIKEGFEPPNFTGFFGVWDFTLWSNYKTFEILRKELDGQKPQLQIELKIANGVQDFAQCEKFPLSILLEKDPEKLPLSVDVLHKEVHLTAEEFSKTFGMDYNDFSVLPKWRQENMKKAVGLF